ncbi:hypothetical protein Gotri_022477 [Gossypium trilobum]|uniref:Uncharacterized protein n=1 Tax=Gossypium trilobum TaxID=34281 RepID=A0A7J9DFV4_9ROSI|nr:hypothetical protein [Gossypium trilobum]
MGAVPISIFTSSSELPIYILTRNKFEWIPYEDLAIREVILEEFFVNPNIWHVKVPLVVYATVEMHKTDKVLQHQHPHTSRPRRPLLNLRVGEVGPSLAPMQEPTLTITKLMPTPPTGQLECNTSVLNVLHTYAIGTFDDNDVVDDPFVTQAPPRSLFYQAGSSSQPPIPRPEDAR